MSSLEQLEGHSLERQLKLSQDYAKEKGFILTDDLRDIGLSAYSGDHLTRGAWGKFQAAALEGTLGPNIVLLVESLDRLSREDPSDAYTQFLTLIQKGIEIHTLVDRQIYNRETIKKNSGLLFLSLGIMMRANEESETKSNRLRSVNTSKRAKMMHSPMGFRPPDWITFEKGKYDLIPERATTLRKIFSLYLEEGMGTYSITRYLNENIETHPRFSKPRKKNRGKPSQNGWQKSYVTKILNSPAVHGECRAHEMIKKKRVPTNIINPNYYPAVVTREEFLRVQSLLKTKGTKSSGRKGKKFSNVFTNLIVCNNCQANVGFFDKGFGPKGGKYLCCTNAQKHFKCSTPHWSYPDFVKSFFKFCLEVDLYSIINSPSVLQKQQELQTKIFRLEEEIEVSNRNFQRKVQLNDELSPAAKKLTIMTLNDLGKKIEQLNSEKEEAVYELRLHQGAVLPNVDILMQSNISDAILDDESEDGAKERRKINGYLHVLIEKVELHSLPNKFLPIHAESELTLPMSRYLDMKGYTFKDEDDYFKFYQENPKRFQDLHRHFKIYFRNGMLRTVHPNLEGSWSMIGFGEAGRKFKK